MLRITVVLIGVLTLAHIAFAPEVSARATAAPAAAPKISVDYVYHGVNRPVSLSIRADDAMSELSLVLLDAEGSILVEPTPIERGRVDLSLLMPQIWQIRQACYLQLLRDGRPVGSALVLQPMLSRLTLWTKQEYRPDGRTRYTRIVGWGPKPDELIEEEAREARRNRAENRDRANADAASPQDGEQQDDAHADESQADSELERTPDPIDVESEQIFSGLRIYPESDVMMHTTLGDIVLAMRPDQAPNTAWNFRELVEGGYYNGIVFHRVVPANRFGQPFVVQAGDPSGTGSGGPGYRLPMEPSRLPHDFGVISMARADDPDSAGGQFFICLSREGTQHLDTQYCAFAYAVLGAQTIRSIAEVELADVATGRPIVPPVIESARLIPAPSRIPGHGRPDRKVDVSDLKPRERQNPPR